MRGTATLLKETLAKTGDSGQMTGHLARLSHQPRFQQTAHSSHCCPLSAKWVSQIHISLQTGAGPQAGRVRSSRVRLKHSTCLSREAVTSISVAPSNLACDCQPDFPGEVQTHTRCLTARLHIGCARCYTSKGTPGRMFYAHSKKER